MDLGIGVGMGLDELGKDRGYLNENGAEMRMDFLIGRSGFILLESPLKGLNVILAKS